MRGNHYMQIVNSCGKRHLTEVHVGFVRASKKLFPAGLGVGALSSIQIRARIREMGRAAWCSAFGRGGLRGWPGCGCGGASFGGRTRCVCLPTGVGNMCCASFFATQNHSQPRMCCSSARSTLFCSLPELKGENESKLVVYHLNGEIPKIVAVQLRK